MTFRWLSLDQVEASKAAGKNMFVFRNLLFSKVFLFGHVARLDGRSLYLSQDGASIECILPASFVHPLQEQTAVLVWGQWNGRSVKVLTLDTATDDELGQLAMERKRKWDWYFHSHKPPGILASLPPYQGRDQAFEFAAQGNADRLDSASYSKIVEQMLDQHPEGLERCYLLETISAKSKRSPTEVEGILEEMVANFSIYSVEGKLFLM
ncbi:hypothetical protein HDU91_003828 [Kappamyces sp. JEL0680]|nr:hypothetical protein HDU91_003828 [Kappamyces sp. JEL0680]